MIKVEYKETNRPIKRLLVECETKDGQHLEIAEIITKQIVLKGHVIISLDTAREMIEKMEMLIKQIEKEQADEN